MDEAGSLDACERDPLCITIETIPLLQNLRSGLIDPDTPDSVKSREDHDGKRMRLVVCILDRGVFKPEWHADNPRTVL